MSIALGVRGAISQMWMEQSQEAYSVQPQALEHPLRVRSGSSDIDVFRQILLDEEYACLNDLSAVGLVIDAGANVGYSSAWFLSRFPDSHAVAIEPDPENFAVLTHNLQLYGERAECIQAGIWSHQTRLVMHSDAYRDGREWARQVREQQPGDTGGLEALSVGDLLNASPHERISLLKMDIEGAEAVVFARGAEDWLPSVDAIAIELHDDSCFGPATDVFFAAIDGHGFEVSRSGELTICRRPQRF